MTLCVHVHSSVCPVLVEVRTVLVKITINGLLGSQVVETP